MHSLFDALAKIHALGSVDLRRDVNDLFPISRGEWIKKLKFIRLLACLDYGVRQRQRTLAATQKLPLQRHVLCARLESQGGQQIQFCLRIRGKAVNGDNNRRTELSEIGQMSLQVANSLA